MQAAVFAFLSSSLPRFVMFKSLIWFPTCRKRLL